MYDTDQIISVFLIVLAVSLVVLIATMIIQGIPLYVMAKKANLDYAWLSFLPIGNAYIMAKIPSKRFQIFNIWGTDNRTEVFYGFLLVTFGGSIASSILGLIPCLGAIIAIAIAVCMIIYQAYMIYDIFATFYEDHDKCVLFTVLSCIIPFFELIMFYVVMNKPRLDGVVIDNTLNLDK